MPPEHLLTLGRWIKRLRAVLDLTQETRIEAVAVRAPRIAFEINP